ncbi:GNAT family N-acetyltransferase [Streptomyces termitum]
MPVPGGSGAYEEEYELPAAAGCVIRPVRSGEWEAVRELRLAALRDPVAALAFVESYEEAAALPDAFWRERAEGGSEDRGTWIRQFVAEAADGRWVGTATVLVERPGGGPGPFGEVTEAQTDVVGVYVRPEARGSGLVDALLRTAVEWSWAQEPPVGRVRLFVNEENGRAEAVYRRFGFVPTGGRADTLGSGEPRDLEYELRR